MASQRWSSAMMKMKLGFRSAARAGRESRVQRAAMMSLGFRVILVRGYLAHPTSPRLRGAGSCKDAKEIVNLRTGEDNKV